jgi:hypothetical protein
MRVRHLLLVLSLSAAGLRAQTVGTFPLDTLTGLTFQGVRGEVAEHRGRKAVRLIESRGAAGGAVGSMAVVQGLEFRNGTIEVEMAGEPGAGAQEAARGFVGIAFHGDPRMKRFENVYLRPTNGRAEDQVRRNHSVQYESIPDFPWFRLRKEFPEKYETYVDLEPGVWTRYRLVVKGVQARLYVHGAAQPTLIVNDLKLGETTGGVGLWLGPGTVAHFSNLRVGP